MKILITGAGGFIGSHLVEALQDAGHELVAAVRHPERVQKRFPGVDAVLADFGQMLTADSWAPLLAGVDGIVNAVGIISESPSQKFSVLHHLAPAALFRAAEHAGTRRIVQISALGADETATSRYHLTKRAADDVLAATDTDWVVLRPSIVYGRGAASMALFAAMAALPVTPLIGGGRQRIQPVHVDDLTRAVLRCLDPQGPSRRRIDLVGPEALSLRELMIRLRHWLGLGPLRALTIPFPFALAMSHVGALVPGLPLTPETLRMLQRGNTGDVEALERQLGFRPVGLEESLRRQPARQPERWHAGLYFMPPLLKAVIALTWISGGLTSVLFHPLEDSLQMLARTGITGSAAPVALYGAAGLDVTLGIAMLWPRLLKSALIAQLAVMIAYTLIITLYLPELWLHPFGPVTKNLPLMAATLCLLVLEREPRWTT